MHEASSRFTVIPAAYIVVRRGDAVLLQLRQNTGYRDGFWACAAAGHVEAGESVIAAAKREATEELDITLSDQDLSPLCVMHRTAGDGMPISERVDFFFVITQWRGTPRIAEPDKVADLAWFALDELPDNVVPHERFVLDRIDHDLPAIVHYGFEPSQS